MTHAFFQSQSDRNCLLQTIEHAGASLTPAEMDTLEDFAKLATVWSRSMDLTSARTIEQHCEILLSDALVLHVSGWFNGSQRFVDVGAGCGAPSLPLCLLNPALHCVLVEPRAKRASFLRNAIGSFELDNRVSVIQGKVEQTKPQVEGAPLDLALSRATFAPEVWLSMGRQLATQVIVMTADKELQRAKAALSYSLPFSSAPRHAYLF